jgi:hypothetical protein
VDVVIGRVAGHLASGARTAPVGAATIFARTARLRFDIVLVAQGFAGPARRHAGEDDEHVYDDDTDVGDHSSPSGTVVPVLGLLIAVIARFVRGRFPPHPRPGHPQDRELGNGDDEGYGHQGEPELERAGIDLATAVGRTHPRELVARQDLAEKTPIEPKAEAADLMAATERKAVAQIVAPTTGRNGMATATATDRGWCGLLHNNRIESLAGLDSAIGLVVRIFETKQVEK